MSESVTPENIMDIINKCSAVLDEQNVPKRGRRIAFPCPECSSTIIYVIDRKQAKCSFCGYTFTLSKESQNGTSL